MNNWFTIGTVKLQNTKPRDFTNINNNHHERHGITRKSRRDIPKEIIRAERKKARQRKK